MDYEEDGVKGPLRPSQLVRLDAQCKGSAMLAPLIVAATVLLASTAHAQTAPARLTDRGRVMVAGAVGGRWSHHPSYSGLHDGAQWEGHVRPGATYFVADHVGIAVSVGGGMGRRDLVIYGSPARARDYDLLAGSEASDQTCGWTACWSQTGKVGAPGVHRDVIRSVPAPGSVFRSEPSERREGQPMRDTSAVVASRWLALAPEVKRANPSPYLVPAPFLPR